MTRDDFKTKWDAMCEMDRTAYEHETSASSLRTEARKLEKEIMEAAETEIPGWGPCCTNSAAARREHYSQTINRIAEYIKDADQ